MNFLRPRRPSEAALLAANILPLAGVLFWDWRVFDVLVVFWLENVMIGIFSVLKMIWWLARRRLLLLLPIVLFFIAHYGAFTLVHGAFVYALFGIHLRGGVKIDDVGDFFAQAGINPWALIWVAGGLFASHLFSFITNFLMRGEIDRTHIGRLMAAPYGRVVMLHVTILLGGGAALVLGQPVWALTLLIFLKTAVDLRAHRKSHKKAQEDPAAESLSTLPEQA